MEEQVKNNMKDIEGNAIFQTEICQSSIPSSKSSTEYYYQLMHMKKPQDHPMKGAEVTLKTLPQKVLAGKMALADYLQEQHQISYDRDSFQPEMQIAIRFSTKNHEALKINVEYGNFNCYITVINVDEESTSDCLNHISEGGFASVYKAYSKHRVALKRIELKEDNFQQTIRSVLREYFLLKIASALQIGPKLIKLYGFDIAIFRNTIEFSMEYCKADHFECKAMQENLKQGLRLLHKFHLVHNDIKPKNIAYSPSFKSFVFLDFGLSQIVKEAIGEKTFTNFKGSVSFCGKQMGGLFVKSESNYIDLFCNDAYSLSKSMNTIHSNDLENCQQDEAPFQICNSLNSETIAKYYENQKILLLKGTLFDSTLKVSQKIKLFSSLQLLIEEHAPNIHSFLAMLPPTQFLIYFTSNFCHSDAANQFRQREKIKSNLFEPFQMEYVGDIFSVRYQLIRYLNRYDMSIQRMNPVEILCNESLIANYQHNTYLQNLIKFIKINGEANTFQDKIKACQVYSRLWSIHELDHLSIYRHVVLNLFEEALLCIEEQASILKETIQTLIALEIMVKEKQIEAFRNIIKSKLSFVRKMSILFEFIIGLQFIKWKIKSTFNYEQLSEIFLIELNGHLDQMNQKREVKQSQYPIFYRLKQIIQMKINHIGQIKYRSPIVTLIQFQQAANLINEGKVLLHQIQVFIVYNEAIFLLNNQVISSQSHINFLAKQIDKQMNGQPVFSYFYFLYYQIAFLKHQELLSSRIYSYFVLQFANFECKSFSIYFKNKMTRFRSAIDGVLSMNLQKTACNKRNQLRSFTQQHKAEIQNIFHLLQQIIDHNPQYHQYLEYVFSIFSFLQKNPIFLNYSIQFINKNQSKIMTLSNVFHKASIYYHNNSLKRELMIIKNMMQLIIKLNPSQNSQEMMETFIENCHKIINTIGCLICKISCNLELKIIEAWLLAKMKKEQQFLDLMSSIIVVHLKYPQLNFEICRIIVVLINLCYSWGQILPYYHLTEFVYRYSIDFNHFSLCLTNCRDISIFVDIYLHICAFYDEFEMCRLINGILKLIEAKRSAKMIATFYYNLRYIIKHVIKSSCDLQLQYESKESHNMVIDLLLHRLDSKDNAYLALYFSAVLQMDIKGVLDQQMLSFIKNNINNIDNYSKSIILSHLFAQVAKYQSKKRRLRYLKCQHLKYTLQKISIKLVMKLKIKQRTNKYINIKYWHTFCQFIQKFYNNIFENSKHIQK